MAKKFLYSQESFIMKDDSISKRTIETISCLENDFIYLTNFKKNEIDIDLLRRLTPYCDFLIIEFHGKLNLNSIEIKCKVNDLESFKSLIKDKWSERASLIKLDSNTIGKLKFKLCEKAKQDKYNSIINS